MVTRRQFSREFKIEAVKLVTERGVAASQAAKDLDFTRTCCASGCVSSVATRSRPFRATGR
jgi:hypothetical protein